MSKIYYVDGATKNNGKIGFQRSYICVTDVFGKALVDEFVGDMTNNQAEVLSLLAVLKIITREKVKKSHIFSDSQLIVKAVNGEREIFSDKLKFYIIHARNLIKNTKAKVSWIPREENKAGWYLERKYEKGWREYWPQPEPDYLSPLSKDLQLSISDFIRWINRQNGISRVDEYRILVWWQRYAYSNGEIKEIHEVLKNTNETLKFIRSNPMKHYQS